MTPQNVAPGSGNIGAEAWSPALARFHMGDAGSSRVTRGSASVADVGHTMETQVWRATEDIENRLQSLSEAFHSNQAWSEEAVD